MGYGYWAVEEKSSGAFVGEIGFADFKRDIAPSMQNVPEVGFAFVSRVHGIGYATEALRAVLAWGDEHLPSRRTVALVNEQNAASIHVLEKYGYAIFEHASFGDVAVVFMQREA
jgi:RimJ/RimL family protein N-acetyltransferase